VFTFYGLLVIGKITESSFQTTGKKIHVAYLSLAGQHCIATLNTMLDSRSGYEISKKCYQFFY